MRFQVQKPHYFPHSVHYCCSSMLHLSETRQFYTKLIVLRSEACNDWPAIPCVVIGRIHQVWDGNVAPLTLLWCHVPTWRHKNNKPIRNETFAASSGDIITNYNVLYCFFTRCITPHKHYHICICDQRNDKQQALLYTAQNSVAETYLQAVSQKHQTVLAKLELPHFIETAFVQASTVGYSSRFRK